MKKENDINTLNERQKKISEEAEFWNMIERKGIKRNELLEVYETNFKISIYFSLLGFLIYILGVISYIVYDNQWMCLLDMIVSMILFYIHFKSSKLCIDIQKKKITSIGEWFFAKQKR